MPRLLLATALLLAWAAPASASELLLHERVMVPAAADSSCSERSRLRAPDSGYLTARLTARRGDWDLAVFRRSGGEPVAASAYRGAREVASGFVRRGERLALRACRLTGAARRARVSVTLQRMAAPLRREAMRVVRVATPTLASKRRLANLDLDPTEHGGRNFVSVILHDARDAARLRSAGFRFRTERTPQRPAFTTAALPSGRTGTYRRLSDYGNEMKALALANPDIVRPFTLPHQTSMGRPVEGLEITTSPRARDGKPVYLQLGMHHAGEWPAAEQPLEWAYELITAYRANDPRARWLVASVRTIVVPVVNPDGFNFSREGGEAIGHGGGLPSGESPSAAESHRKTCAPPPTGCVVNGGVDPNRNYGDLWGGPGASSDPSSNTYRGPSPFSEPEAQNIRELLSSRQVVVMITNHTYGNKILRQPGLASEPPAPDEAAYAQLGGAMAAQNGYANVFSYQIGYDHVGTTDGYSYYVTGGLGYVFESGSYTSHPPYAEHVQDYEHGTTGSGAGNRGAYYVATEAAANPALHSRLTGSAPPGSILRLTKSFRNRTWTDTTAEHLETTMQVPASGLYEWHVNPSGRPLVPGERWTLTCERPERTVITTQQITIVRGASVSPNPRPCGGGPIQPPPEDTRAQPRLRVKMVAGVRGRIYRARVAGSLRGVPDLERCDGVVALELLARAKALAKRRAGLDERCGFERRFRILRHNLPKALRGKSTRVTLKAVASWRGNEFLAPAKRGVRTRVRRRG